MQYQLKKVNIHLPYWLNWTPFTNYIDSQGDNTAYENWVKSTKEQGFKKYLYRIHHPECLQISIPILILKLIYIPELRNMLTDKKKMEHGEKAMKQSQHI